MVGIVLVSHSRALALAVQELVRSMTVPMLPLAIAAGAGDDRKELGTDAIEICEAILSVLSSDGVLILMDMGSAILSAETAVDLLDEPMRKGIRFCCAPFVEGAVAAGVTAHLGSTLDQVHGEAIASLKQKQIALASHLPLTNLTRKSDATFQVSCSAPHTVRLTIRNPHGLHARPAAKLISATRDFHSLITISNLTNRRGPVSIRSLSRLASLEILQDNQIEVSAQGDDAATALKKIAELIQLGLGDELSSRAHSATVPAQAQPVRTTGNTIGPVPISPGIAIGPAFYFQATQIDIPLEKIEDVAKECDRLSAALTAAKKSLTQRRDAMAASIGTANAEIYDAQILSLQDPDLLEETMRLIRDEHLNATLAWSRTNQQMVSRYKVLTDPYLRERAVDLEDVGNEVLHLLAGKDFAHPILPQPGILIADNLTPQQVSNLDLMVVQGVFLLDGGPTAHSSILLSALGIPAIVQARHSAAYIDLAKPGILAFDGSSGKIWIAPDDELIAKLHARQKNEASIQAEERKACAQPASTRDGHTLEIFANIGGLDDVAPALESGAEGIGLLRTEFLFLDRELPPTEEEQLQALSAISEKMKGKPFIVRTLDAGGDKELPYLGTVREDNPFLGVRAIRLCFSHEEMFLTQLRAILRAGYGNDLRIMFPMIATISDLDRAMAFLLSVHEALESEGIKHLWPVKSGIMIEIPSAVMTADALAEKAEFFSIGTNDLTQYALAADRGNPGLAAYHDALHPAVLRMIQMVVAAARKHNRPVAICGEAASDDSAAPIFLGLGVQELSLIGAKIPHLKAHLRRQSLADMQKLARAALQCRTAAEVRELVL